MKLDRTYIGTKWIVNASNYPNSKGCSATITNAESGTVSYIYYFEDGREDKEYHGCSEMNFLNTFDLADKGYILACKIRKIQESL